MATAHDVARYFLMLADSGAEDAGETITHLKLQKLLYYAQGFRLVIYDEPLFPEDVRAWDHGPVVQALWPTYRDYGSAAIPPDDAFDADLALTHDQKELLDDVWNAYGQFSAWKLREMTHQEPPWREAYVPGVNALISNDAMRSYFGTQVQDA